MAVLETVAHIDDTGLPLDKYLVEITVPDSVWSLRQRLPVAALPVTWDAVPAGLASVRMGSTWLAALSAPILLVPSVIVPEEDVALINPRHPRSVSITAAALRKYQYNVLFRR